MGGLIDLSNGFDTVDHNMLLEKLDHYGIRGLILNWFRSYLSNRQQYLEFNSLCSSRQQTRVNSGPSSILMYINDLCNVSNVLEFILFADDRNIFFSQKIEILYLQLLTSKRKNYLISVGQKSFLLTQRNLLL